MNSHHLSSLRSINREIFLKLRKLNNKKEKVDQVTAIIMENCEGADTVKERWDIWKSKRPKLCKKVRIVSFVILHI